MFFASTTTIPLTITIVDDSPLLIRCMRPDPDPKTPLSERGAGGWGIFFIKKLMDKVTYTYEDSRNRLVMVKNISKQPPISQHSRAAPPISRLM